jgi:hypothetical protein
MTPDKIVVTITPRDVLTTEDYTDNHDCALCKAIRRKLRLKETNYLSVGPHSATIQLSDKILTRYSVQGGFSPEDFHELTDRALAGHRFKVKKTLTRVV